MNEEILKCLQKSIVFGMTATAVVLYGIGIPTASVCLSVRHVCELCLDRLTDYDNVGIV